MNASIITSLKRGEDGFFPRVQAGQYELCFLAQESAHCMPQGNFDRLVEYDSVEVVVMRNGEAVKCPVNRFLKQFDSFFGSYARYMPLKDVQGLYEELVKL